MKIGCGFPNGALSDAEFAEFVSIPWSNVVLLDHQAKYLPRLRQALPNARLVVRYYAKNVLSDNPSDYAQAVCTEAIHWRDYCRDWILGNEFNLALENAEHWDDPDYVGNWLIDVAAEFRRLCPWVIRHLPAFAPIENWWRYYTNIVPHLELFDVVDAHCYNSFSEMESTLNAVLSQTDKPVFVSEYNGEGSLEFAKHVNTLPQVTGACYYVWRWFSPDDANWNRDLKGSALETELRELATERGLEVTEVDNVEQGMKAIWKKMLGKTFDPTNAFFRKAVELAREGVYVHPLKGGPWEYKVGNYFCTYTDPPMHVLDEDWDNVQTGFPPNQ